MIQIKFYFKGKKFTKIKKIQFCRNHERNLEILYEIARESIKRTKRGEIEQIMTICGYQISREIRKKTMEKIIHNKLIREISEYYNFVKSLRDFKNLSIEAQIDNIPKKIYTLNLNEEIFV